MRRVMGCFSLTAIKIPSSVTSLGDCCFMDCSLTAIEIPYSVTSLGEWCFMGCSLTAIEIPYSVTNIGDGSFGRCSSLASIVVDAENPYYDSREECNAIIETESNTMIAGCKNTFIPSSVTNLRKWCFNGASLASTEIPSSVTNLGEQCFCFCNSLKTVIYKMENVVNDFSLFVGTTIEEATLYVPQHLFDNYKSTYPWNGFGSILPLTETGINDIQEAGISFRSVNGNVVMSGLADGTPMSYYSAEGRLLGKTMVDGGTASFSAKPNTFVIVKIGKQSIKVGVK